LGHCHGLFFERFTYTTEASVNGRANADFWKSEGMFLHNRCLLFNGYGFFVSCG
jgi:hypothetical protein